MSIQKMLNGITSISNNMPKTKTPVAKKLPMAEKLSETVNPKICEIYQNQGLTLHYQKLKRRLEKLNSFDASPNHHRFGKDGINSILECADSEKNISKINEMLDRLEKGEDIWTYDIVSCFEKEKNRRYTSELLESESFREKIASTLKTTSGTPVFGPIEEVLTKKSKLPEVIALEKEMKSMGYDANFCDNLETAQIITKAYKAMNEKGFKMPKEVALMTPNRKGILGYRPFSTKENRLNVPILFNKTLKRDISEVETPSFLSDIGVKYNISDKPESVVYHEIGHFLHEPVELSTGEASEIWKKMADNGYDLDMAKEVGYYAMTGDKFNTGKEFIAEVFAGLMEGKSFSKKIMDVYKALKGPLV